MNTRSQDTESEGLGRLLSGDGTMGLFVSLYLILLAFFIVLQVASDPSLRRSEEVVSSVKETFQFEKTEGDTAESVAEDGGATGEAAVAFAAINGLFRDVFELEGRYIASGGGILAFELPVADLFVDGALALRPDRRKWLADLVDVVKQDITGRRFEITVLFGESGDRTITGDQLSIRRASHIARNMVAYGLPEAGPVIGLDAGSVDHIRLAVRLRDQELPRADLIPWRLVQ